MADLERNLKIGVNVNTTKTGPDAEAELAKIRAQVKGAKDDTASYNAWLEKNSSQVQRNYQERAKGAADTSKTLTELQANVKKTGAVEQEAAEKTESRHKQAKEALKGLAAQYPELAHLAHLALNPISLSVAAIVGAFALWDYRVKSLTRSLGGIEMPDIGEDDISRINRSAEAWHKLAEKMAEAATNSKKIKTELEATLATIKANDELKKAFGIDTGTSALSKEAGAKAGTAAKLEADAKARLARAGTPGSVESEAAVGKDVDAAVAEAVKEKKEAEARIDTLLKLKNPEDMGDWFARMWRGPKFVADYGYPAGAHAGLDANVDAAIARERGNISDQQGIIDSGARFARTKASRAVQRGVVDAANADIATADKMDSEVLALLQQIAINTARNATGGKDPGGAPNVMSDPAGFALWVQQMAQLTVKMPEILAAIQRANSVADSLAGRQKDSMNR